MNRILILLFLLPLPLFSQKVNIGGTISDKSSGEQLIQANVYIRALQQGTVTNYYGFYSISVEAGKDVEIEYSYIGYEPVKLSLNLKKDTIINIELSQSLTLKEITVMDRSPQQTVETSQMSTVSLNPKQVKSMPVLFGEVDVLKTLQMMPGVAGGTEGTAGIYVRGGGPDQNLFLLDGVPVYNVSHALGIFSVFNADAIKSVDLVKGGFPARYGSRLSSVVDIRMKEGDLYNYHGEATLGLISSKILLEGPISKGKTSFLFAARRTYIDAVAAPFIQLSNTDPNVDINLDLYFYDINAKINHKFSDHDRLFLSVYNGRDVLGLGVTDKYSYSNYEDRDGTQTLITYDNENTIGFRFFWGNLTSALRWNHVFNSKLFSNTTLTYTKYQFQTSLGFDYKSKVTGEEEESESFDLSYYSNIRDFGIKQDFDFIPTRKQYIRMGGWYTYHTYTPGTSALNYNSSGQGSLLDTTLGFVNIPAFEVALYAEDNIEFSNRLKANIGVHYSGFNKGKTYYQSVQPRASLRYKLDKNISVKASFAQMTQYLNLLANSIGNLPTDLWVPATENIKPQESWQAALGGALAINDVYEITLEGYYKKMDNLVSYKEGESFFLIETNWEDKVTQGSGEAYGMELFFQKTQGKLTGWLGYTLAWSDRYFKDLNNGMPYPFKYDRRHDLSVVGNYKLNDSWEISANVQLNSGNSFTLYDQKMPLLNSPDTKQYWNNYYVYGPDDGNIPFFVDDNYFFESKNSYKMPFYKRVDLGITYIKEMTRTTHKFNLSVYNVTAAKNPTFMFPGTRWDQNLMQDLFVVRQFSLLPFPLPTLSYTIKF
ncbi:TonB-dependent receptor domain-containing protein [Saccharicrinis sp. FJH2]|uniref:TonB-dependent receptor n=1 Tax=Saccharicrinis sp. FJH65 TaxID=3344659 RepID=UPI0035F43CA1